MQFNVNAKSMLAIHGTTARPSAVTSIDLFLENTATEQDLRSIVITAEFDGEETVWAPITDFFGTGVGTTNFQDWYRTASTRASAATGSCPSRQAQNQPQKPW